MFMTRSLAAGAALLAVVVLGTACDGPFTRRYTIRSEEAVWAVPLPPSWGSYHDQENAARWIPALPRRDWKRDDMEEEIALYQVTIIAGLNETPHHPIAIFRAGYDWKFICPTNLQSTIYPHPAGTEACLTSVTKLESGSFFTGGAWDAKAEATVRLEKDKLKDAGSPSVRCRGEDLSGAVCTTTVEPKSPMKTCHVKMLRIWQPDRTAWHNVSEVELQTDEAGRTVLRWPFRPTGEFQGVDHPTREHQPPEVELPPQTYALFACETVDAEPIRFVAAPVTHDPDEPPPSKTGLDPSPPKNGPCERLREEMTDLSYTRENIARMTETARACAESDSLVGTSREEIRRLFPPPITFAGDEPRPSHNYYYAGVWKDERKQVKLVFCFDDSGEVVDVRSAYAHQDLACPDVGRGH